MHVTVVLIDLGMISCHSDDLVEACWERLVKEGRLCFTCTVNLINLDIV